jgi:hypothetical protein
VRAAPRRRIAALAPTCSYDGQPAVTADVDAKGAVFPRVQIFKGAVTVAKVLSLESELLYYNAKLSIILSSCY